MIILKNIVKYTLGLPILIFLSLIFIIMGVIIIVLSSIIFGDKDFIFLDIIKDIWKPIK